jgi:hypothetical protein
VDVVGGRIDRAVVDAHHRLADVLDLADAAQGVEVQRPQDPPGPADGGPGRPVELHLALGVDDRVVVVAPDDRRAALDHEIHAAAGVRPVAHDVPEADQLVDAHPLDPSQHGLQGVEVAMDVGDHGVSAHGSILVTQMRGGLPAVGGRQAPRRPPVTFYRSRPVPVVNVPQTSGDFLADPTPDPPDIW